MILKHAGANVDPKKLNTWLGLHGGYTAGGAIYWATASYYDGSGGVLFKGLNNDTDNWSALSSQLAQNRLVIVKVDAYSSQPGIQSHWVLVTKKIASSITDPSSYSINDPWDLSYTGKTLKHYYNSSHTGATFFAMRYYSGPWLDTTPPPPPTHVSPVNGSTIVTLTPTFTWNRVSNADYYGLYISEPPYGENHLVFNSREDYGHIYGTSFHLPTGKLARGVTYYWNMQAYNSEGGWGSFSTSWHFTTTIHTPPVAYMEYWDEEDEGWWHWGTLGTSLTELSLRLRGTESKNRSTTTIVRYEWDFGDGDTAQGEYVNHTYTTGNYDITLTVYDAYGASGSETLKIEVRGEREPPVAYMQRWDEERNEWRHWGTLGTSLPELALQLRGTESKNRSTTTIVRYEWDFGDGDTAQGEYVNHTYTTGNYDITLTVYDAYGASGSETLKIEVRGEREEPIHFPDPNLQQVIRDAIDKPTGDIYQSDLVGLTTLETGSKGISDLSGLEYCANLDNLRLDCNNISDISVLSGLTNLFQLAVMYNNISDISALSGLTNLIYLELDGNNISDISALSGLTNLIQLGLRENNISDISALSGLTSLSWLDLWKNNISDISALSGLTNLTKLWMGKNNISNISALSGLTNLIWLYLEENDISDIQPLVNNTGLGAGDEVDIWYNYLDLTPGSNDKQNIQALTNRGVGLTYEPQNLPEFAPSLSIPAHAPMRAVAHVGTRVTFAILVRNAGSYYDTIKLSHSGEGEWPITLSKTSVRESPGTETIVYLSLYIQDTSDKDVTITGTSSGDPSQTSSITLKADGVDNEGLFLVVFTFHNPPDSSQAQVALSTSGPATLSTSTFSIPSSHYRNVSLLFDPRRSDTSVREVTLTSTNVATEESVLLPTRFDADEIIATDFNMATDSYSFPNFGPGILKNCFGMSETSILFLEGDISLPDSVSTTYDLEKDQIRLKIVWYQWIGGRAIWGGAKLLFQEAKPSEQYNILERSIRAGHPMIIAVENHAVVAYKIVIRGSLSYIFIYDSESPLIKNASGFNQFAFPYATYTDNAFNYDGLDEFLAIEAAKRFFGLVVLSVECPVDVTITDQYGRKVSSTGISNIPGADMWIDETGEMKIFYLPLNLNYQARFDAYAEDSFTLTVFLPSTDETAYVSSFSAVDIQKGGRAELSFAAGSPASTMTIDQNNDGITDAVKDPTITKVGQSGLEPVTPVVGASQSITHGPNPVPSQGCVFWLNLPDDTSSATVKIFDIDGAELLGICLDPSIDRYPQTGRWLPQDDQGRLLGSGLYLYVVEIKHTDGTTTYSFIHKLAISR